MQKFYSVNSKLRTFFGYLIPGLGILLIVVVLVLIWFWETAGREYFLYEERVVFKQDIAEGILIDESMLTYQSFEKSKIFSEAVIDPNEIIGLETTHYIPRGALLHKKYFASTEIELAIDQYIARIPSEWIYSIPNSLRRQDKVYFYIFKPSNGASVVLFETEIAYVKDSMNREIVSVGSRERIDGSGIIAEVSVVLTLEELNQLTEVIKDGNKIIILYAEGIE